MCVNFIDDPRKWRVSMSGYSIKTGWGDEKKFIAKYPGITSPIDGEKFREWMDNAQLICDLYNAQLSSPQPSLTQTETDNL